MYRSKSQRSYDVESRLARIVGKIASAARTRPKFLSANWAVEGIRVTACLTLILAGFSANALYADDVPLGSTVPYNGHYYYLPDIDPTAIDWQFAQSYAAAQTVTLADGTVLQGHLLTVSDQGEQDFISSTFLTNWWQKFFLGAYQYSNECEPDGAWAWLTGEEYGNIHTDWSYHYLNASDNQPGNDPNPWDANEDVLGMLINFGSGGPPGTGNDTWHDFPSVAPPGSSKWWFVVEFDDIGDHFTALDAPPDNIPLYCQGFEAPMDKGAVQVKNKRALPLKAALFDGDGNAVTDFDITASPVVQVTYQSGIGDAADVTQDALPVGHGTDDNQFEFVDDKWRMNLHTKNLGAPGTYVITMESGNICEYAIGSSCTASFVVYE